MKGKVMKFRKAYDASERYQYQPQGESLTQQHFAQEADIKTIIKKHDRTGIIENVARGVAQYGDYSEINEYREALDIVRNADETFQMLPSELRKAFENDAGAFFEFATNPANEEKMVEMGLKPAPPSPPPSQHKEEKKTAEKAEKDDE
jgi:phage internal scaffolding protein